MLLWTDFGVVGTSGHSLTSGFSTLMLPPTRTSPFKSVIGNMKWRRSGYTNREFEKLNMPSLHPLFSQPVVDSARKQLHSTSVWPLPLLSIGTSPIAAPWTGWGVPSPSVSSDLPSSAYGGEQSSHGHFAKSGSLHSWSGDSRDGPWVRLKWLPQTDHSLCHCGCFNLLCF